LLVAGTVMVGLFLVGLSVALYQLVKSQGRLLLRIDDLERRLDALAPRDRLGPAAERRGLAVGAEFEPFELPDLDGKSLSLKDLHGKRTLLVNWSTTCGFCDRIAPDLAALSPNLAEDARVVLVSRGDIEANRRHAEEHGLDYPILLQGSAQALSAFGKVGTPAAYLLDPAGRVARPLAIGANQVPALAGELTGKGGRKPASLEPEGRNGRNPLPGARPLAQSRLERDGLKAGTVAPSFALSDLDGQTVSLEDFRGRRVLLAFTDTKCGPCDQLLPRLAELDREHRGDGLAVLVVGRGDAEANRRKAARHGVEFPVVLQDGWKLSKEYGIFATPVGFLIDKEGVIGRGVARGVEEILSLASEMDAARGQR
jgi:peroxiredoxin